MVLKCFKDFQLLKYLNKYFKEKKMVVALLTLLILLTY